MKFKTGMYYEDELYCLKATILSKKTKSAKIKVGYNTTITGPFAKNIEVFSNDPVNNRSVITIKGTVEAPAEAATMSPAAVAAPATMDKAASKNTKPKDM